MYCAGTGPASCMPAQPLPHFNEVDEGVAVDALVTNRIWTAMGFDPATTLHDVRWGETYGDEFVWVMLISGSVPASHNGGYDHSYSKRQPKMYFPLGGGTLSGCSKPGEIVWSRVYIEDGRLHVDIGRGHVADLPAEETQRRLDATTPEWPIMHAVLHGVDRDQLMAKHKANHVQVAYCPRRRHRQPGGNGEGRPVRHPRHRRPPLRRHQPDRCPVTMRHLAELRDVETRSISPETLT